MILMHLNNRFQSLFFILVIFFVSVSAGAETGKKKDVHYNDVGFFDVHVCNWPKRDPFLLAVFSTYRFDELKSVKVYRSDGSELGQLDLSRYRVIAKKGKPEKRAFLTQFELSSRDRTGWYQATIELKNGKQFHSRDRVLLRTIDRPVAVFPANNQKLETPPAYLEWKAIPGAGYYKVFLRDVWDDGKLILETKLIKDHRFKLPKGLIKPDGIYRWKINARDVNEDPELGDFNSGSLSTDAEFSVK